MFYLHHSAGWGWGWWFLMVIGMIAFWALIIFVFVWALRGGSQPSEPNTPEQPGDILKRRLAHGEITIDDYERLHEAISRPASPPTAIAETDKLTSTPEPPGRA
jgi:uncharacterized membrane protein